MVEYHIQVPCRPAYTMVLACMQGQDGKLELAYVLEQGGKQVCELVLGGKLKQARELVHVQCWQLHGWKCWHG